MKLCKKCGQSKSVDLFGKNKRYADGCWPYCKACDCERTAEYRRKNPEKVREIGAKSRAKNPSRVAETKRKYRENNAEKVRLSRRAAYQRSRETELAGARKYKAENPHVIREIVAMRVAKKKAATPAWVDRKAIRDMHCLAVRLTKITGIVFHVDHIVPLKSDLVCGLHWHGNMQVITGSENQSKSNRHWPDMPTETHHG